MKLIFENVTKLYGPVIGVNEINCTIGPGILGLFGANGAGKSTMLKLASGQLRPTLGKVHVGGFSTWSSAAKRCFGYTPDTDSFYERMTGRNFVYTMARLHGFSRSEARERTHETLHVVGMADRANRKLAGCSHGMRQRLKLAQALVHDPPVLLLDEPMTGIDPGGRHDLTRILQQQAADGKTILISTHILSQVEPLASEIIMLAHGRMVASGKLAEIRGLLENQPLTVLLVCERSRELASRLLAREEVHSAEVQGERLIVRTANSAQFFELVMETVLADAFELSRMEVLDAGAEAVFHYLDRGVT